MEQVGIASSMAIVETASAVQSEGDRLFQELLDSEPGPTIENLMQLLSSKVAPFVKVAKAILAHPERDSKRTNRLVLSAAKAGRIHEIWADIPKSDLDETMLYDLIVILSRGDWRKYIDIFVEAGRLFLQKARVDSIEFDLQTVIEKIPPLRNETWDKLVEYESPNATSWAIPQFLKALSCFRGEEAKQKALWLLECWPSIAEDLMNLFEGEVAIQAAQVILAQESFDHRAMGKLMCRDKFRDTDIPERAIKRTLSEAGEHSMLIILSTFSTEADKERAADLLLLGSPDIICLETIMNGVPSRAEQARLRRDELVTAREAAKTQTQRLMECIDKLEVHAR